MAVGSDGNEHLVEWLRPVVSADVKVVLLALGRMGASANSYCFFILEKRIREANKSCLRALDGVSTTGSLRRAMAEVEEVGEYMGAGGWKERMEAACHRDEFILTHSKKSDMPVQTRQQQRRRDPRAWGCWASRFFCLSTPFNLTSFPTPKALGSTTFMLGTRLRQQSRLLQAASVPAVAARVASQVGLCFEGEEGAGGGTEGSGGSMARSGRHTYSRIRAPYVAQTLQRCTPSRVKN